VALWPLHGPGHPARFTRLARALSYSSFDSRMWARRGFAGQRDELLDLIQRFVKPEHRGEVKYNYAIPDEHLAVLLWVVTQVSFEKADHPVRQFGCPNDRVIAAFQKLSQEGLVAGGCRMSSKISAMKRILEGAQLIQCVDRGYRFCPGRPGSGVGKKYAAGASHPRHAEWLQFRATVEVRHIAGGNGEERAAA
jgi:hypothetical protein